MSDKVIAEYDYVGQDDGQLTFNEGDIITVLEEDDSGWWTGRLPNGQEGYFPETYVKPYEEPKKPPPVPKTFNGNKTKNNNNNGHINAPTKQAPKKQAPKKRAPPPTHEQTEVAIHKTTNNPISLMRKKSSNKYEKVKDSPGDIPDMYYNGALNLKHNPNSKTRFGIAAHYMVIAASLTAIFLGFSGMYWGSSNASPALKIPAGEAAAIGCGLYCFFLGIFAWIWEATYGQERLKVGVPVRAVIYFLIGIPACIVRVTALAGCFYMMAGIWDFMAWVKAEEYEVKQKNKYGYDKEKAKKFAQLQYYWDSATGWYTEARQQSKLRKYLFLFVYLLFNIGYTLERAHYYRGIVSKTNRTGRKGQDAITDQDPNTVAEGDEKTLGELMIDNKNDLVLGDWYPVAKMFGNLLDINCAFIVLPVCRSFIRFLYNKSTDQRTSSKLLAFVLSFVPLDKAIQFHKVMAFLIVLGSVFHGWAHYNHYAEVPETYAAVFGPTVWVSGILILTCMFFLYCTSFEAVRRGKFELFWYTHHLFVIFFLSILFHGADSLNPNFWKWFLVPGFLYLIERLLREQRAKKPIGVVSVTHMNNKHAKVFCLELEKKPGQPTYDHQEGQYVFVCAPIITKWQWHPFTISSPPDQKTLTLHIRNMGDGTWTGRLQDFFQALAPRKAYAELFHREAYSLVPQTKAPDGSNLICVDGPMAAPTQHLGTYGTSIVVGAGIGCTPVRAVLLSIVYYRFKRGIGRSFPDHAYMVWIVNYKQLDAYRFMVRTLKEAEDEMFDMRAKNSQQMKQKTLQIHVFVTRAPDNPKCDLSEVANTENDRDRDLELWGPTYLDTNRELANQQNTLQKQNAPFSILDIWRVLKEPRKEPVAIGDIIVHSGRPKWGELFQPIQQHHKGEKIGVMFCGPEIIAKDLKKNCGEYTDFSTNTVFMLHKENF